MRVRSKWWWAGPALAAALLLPSALRGHPVALAWLTHPAAWVAAQLASGHVDWTGSEPVVSAWGRFVRVTSACSGADFLGLSCALLLWAAVRRRPRWAWFVPPAAWLLTLVANTGRLLLVLLAEPLMGSLSEALARAVHMGLGVAVFLPLLIVAYAIWERMLCRERIIA